MPVRIVFTIVYDGQPHPTTGSPDFDTSTYRRVDANNSEYSRLKAGRVVMTGTRAISSDGKTSTVTAKGVTLAGQQFEDVYLFEKQ
jgi:hypothetical protein